MVRNEARFERAERTSPFWVPPNLELGVMAETCVIGKFWDFLIINTLPVLDNEDDVAAQQAASDFWTMLTDTEKRDELLWRLLRVLSPDLRAVIQSIATRWIIENFEFDHCVLRDAITEVLDEHGDQLAVRLVNFRTRLARDPECRIMECERRAIEDPECADALKCSLFAVRATALLIVTYVAGAITDADLRAIPTVVEGSGSSPGGGELVSCLLSTTIPSFRGRAVCVGA